MTSMMNYIQRKYEENLNGFQKNLFKDFGTMERYFILTLVFIAINKFVTKQYFERNTMFFLILLFIVESMNTAIEYLCDLISKEYNDDIKNVKDIMGSITISVWIFYLIYLALFYI